MRYVNVNMMQEFVGSSWTNSKLPERRKLNELSREKLIGRCMINVISVCIHYSEPGSSFTNIVVVFWLWLLVLASGDLDFSVSTRSFLSRWRQWNMEAIMKSTLLLWLWREFEIFLLRNRSKSARTILSSLGERRKSNEPNKPTHDECEIFMLPSKTGNCENFFFVLPLLKVFYVSEDLQVSKSCPTAATLPDFS